MARAQGSCHLQVGGFIKCAVKRGTPDRRGLNGVVTSHARAPEEAEWGYLVYYSASGVGLAVSGAAAALSHDGHLPPFPGPPGPRTGRGLASETAVSALILPGIARPPADTRRI